MTLKEAKAAAVTELAQAQAALDTSRGAKEAAMKVQDRAAFRAALTAYGPAVLRQRRAEAVAKALAEITE